MSKLALALMALLFLTGCTEEKEVVGISTNSNGTVNIWTETSAKIGDVEVAKFEGVSLPHTPDIIISNADGTVTVYYADGTEITAPRK